VVGRADSGDGEFVEASLMEWSETPTLAAGVPGVTHYLPPSDDAISKPIALVAAGVLPRQTLNRFLLGAWVKGISADSLTKLLSLYDSDDLSAQEAEAGLTMLHFWIDGGRQKPNDSLVAIGVALLRRSGPLGDHSGGLTYARSQMLSELPVLPEQRLDLTIDGLKSRSLTTGSELEVLDQVAGQLPEETVARLVDALLTDTEGWSLWVSRDHLLSRLAETVGANLVTSRLMARTQDEQMRALQHISFLSEEPDPIFLTLLEERTDEEFLNEASVRFLYPGEVVVGSYADYLRGRKRMLESWRDRTESRTLTRWAEDLMPTLDAEIHRNIERETEEEY
jgi:hypothetical protein